MSLCNIQTISLDCSATALTLKWLSVFVCLFVCLVTVSGKISPGVGVLYPQCPEECGVSSTPQFVFAALGAILPLGGWSGFGGQDMSSRIDSPELAARFVQNIS